MQAVKNPRPKPPQPEPLPREEVYFYPLSFIIFIITYFRYI